MTKIAINGFGRIGRCVLKAAIKEGLDLEFVAINDLADNKTLAHLFKYDTAYGVFNGDVSVDENSMIVDGKKIAMLAEKDPEKLPWKDLGVDVVLDCTVLFKEREGLGKNLKAALKR